MLSITQDNSIEPQGQDCWRLRVERELGGASATGEVLLRGPKPSPSDDLPHKALAGSRAWLSLAEARFDADDIEGAIACAQNGLDELGASYTTPSVTDDTSLLLLMAKDQIKQGRAEAGAKRLLKVLRERIGLYEGLHEATLAGT